MVVNITSLGIGDLHLSNSPARIHSKHQERKAELLMSAQGILTPIVVDERYRVIDGNLRVTIARRLGIERLNAIVISGLTEAKRIELELALNRLPEDTTWDAEQLKLRVEALISFETDLSLTGFDTPELDQILTFEIISDDSEIGEHITPVTQRGDIWRVGTHIIACGSALDPPKGLLRAPGFVAAKACITDPPYNVPTAGHIRTQSNHPEFAMAAGEMSQEEFTQFLTTSLQAALAFLDPNALIYAFMDWRGIAQLYTAAQSLSLIQQNLCVWSKTNAGMGSFYRSQHELVGVFSRTERYQNNIQLGRMGRYRTNVWHYDGVTSFGTTRNEDLQDHPTVKPTQMIADIILDCTSLGDWVYDPFLGSGTTCQAAEQTRRRCLGIEYEPRYVDVTLKRLKDRCGLDAYHLNSDLSYTQIAQERASLIGADA